MNCNLPENFCGTSTATTKKPWPEEKSATDLSNMGFEDITTFVPFLVSFPY